MIEIAAQYLVYIGAIGFPTFFVLRWVYSQWWKANLPAFWAWLLQQRRRDKTIRETRKKVSDLEQRLAVLEENRGGGEADETLADVLIRLDNCERMLAQLRHRLRQKGIMIDG